jgi:hypothetical protein
VNPSDSQGGVPLKIGVGVFGLQLELQSILVFPELPWRPKHIDKDRVWMGSKNYLENQNKQGENSYVAQFLG